jgi:hypothetical protein
MTVANFQALQHRADTALALGCTVGVRAVYLRVAMTI